MAGKDSSAHVKGGILRARLQFVRDRAGEEGVERVLARLSAEDRDVLTGLVLHVAAYPMELNLRLDDAIARELSPDNPDQVFLDMGRASADVNLTGPHKAYVRVGDPHHLLGQAPNIYAAYYTVGHRTYEKTGKRSGILRTFDAESVTRTDCLTVVGWYIRAIEICGGKDVEVVETQCRASGAPHCEYACSWS